MSRQRRTAARVGAWSAAALATGLAAYAVVLAPGAELPWKSILVPLVFAVPGALIASQLPRHPVGWLLLFEACCFAGIALGTQWLAAGRETAAAWAAWFPDRAGAVVVPAMLLLLLLLPDGELPSRRWRPVAAVGVGVQLLLVVLWSLVSGPVAAPDSDTVGADELLNPVGVLPQSWGPVLADLEWLLVVPFLLGIAAVAQRIRRPVQDQRPRMVSVLVAVVVFVLFALVPRLVWPAAGEWFDLAGATLLAAAIFAAVLRGRYEQVQVVVSHTFVYAVLTCALALAYLGLVALAAQVEAPAAVTGVLTGVVALALLPARGFLQRLVRRAMYGDRGEPQRALRRLSSSVLAADDLDAVLDGLVRSVRSSLRARWVTAEFRGHRGAAGVLEGRTGRVEERALEGGDGESGLLQVGLPSGRVLSRAEQELLTDLVQHGARAARIVCLAEDLATARQTIVTGREDERSRLRRDLHDDLGPVLAGLAMQLGSLPELLGQDADLAADRLGRLELAARSALERMRLITRGLRPPALDDLGLVGALVESGRAIGLHVRVLEQAPCSGLTPAVEVAAYRIVNEAMLNAHRHAGAEAVDIVVDRDGDDLLVLVRDDGPGMVDAPLGVGVPSMRERAAELGGTVEHLARVDGGTTVSVRLPAPGSVRS